MNDTWLDEENSTSDLVSVVIPTYNRAGLLVDALDSIARQIHRPIEIIVVDDGSTDDTAQRVIGWKKAHEDSGLAVQYFHQMNQGAPVARNYGARQARGEFVQFWDSDDIMAPEKLVHSVEAMRSENRLYAVCDCSFWDVNLTQRRRSVRYAHKAHDPVGDTSRTLNTQVVLYRREMLNRMGPWDEELACGQDWEFTLRIAALGVAGAAVEEDLVKIRETENSISRVGRAKSWQARIMCCDHAERWAKAHDGLNKQTVEMVGRHLAATSRILMIAGHRHDAAKIYADARRKLRPKLRIMFDLHYLIQCAGGVHILSKLGLM